MYSPKTTTCFTLHSADLTVQLQIAPTEASQELVDFDLMHALANKHQLQFWKFLVYFMFYQLCSYLLQWLQQDSKLLRLVKLPSQPLDTHQNSIKTITILVLNFKSQSSQPLLLDHWTKTFCLATRHIMICSCLALQSVCLVLATHYFT